MLCEGVMLYMFLVTVFGNKLNNRFFFFILGWGKYLLNMYIRNSNPFTTTVRTCIGPAIPIVAISAGIAHEHYGTDH